MPNLGIQTGLWVDWVRGPIYGPSITLTTTSSNALIAVASLWVGNLLAGWIWATFVPLVYYWRNKKCHDNNRRDGIHVQHQLVWRNVGDPLGAAIDNFTIYRNNSSFIAGCGRRWKSLRGGTIQPSSNTAQTPARNQTKIQPQSSRDAIYNRTARTCSAVAIPFLIFAGFFVAGVFVSFIANPNHDVLVASNLNSCGLWNYSIKSFPGSTPNEVQNAYVAKVLNDTLAARTYSRSCYSSDAQAVDSVSCSFFTHTRLGYSTGFHHRACPFNFYPGQPFEGGACDAPRTDGTFVLFSNMLDSSADLGINAHESNAVHFQKNVSCSVLSLTNRTGNSTYYSTQPNTTYTTYLFGSIDDSTEPGSRNVTAFIDVAASQSSYMPFSVMAVYATAGVQTQHWTPSPPFNLSDGDVSLFFLTSNSIVYEKRVHDPYFLATDPTSEPIGLPKAGKYFQAVNPVSVMGCVDKYMICSKPSGPCTDPGGVFSLPTQLKRLDLNEHQFVTAARILDMFKNTDTYSSVYGTGSAALRASDTVLGVLSTGLPANQWEIEAEGWFQISLAKMQAYAVEYASNSEHLGRYGIVHFPEANSKTRPVWHSQCFAQRIANPGQYQVFSLLGLMLLLVFGIFFFVAKEVVACFMERDTRAEYTADDKFELQRMVLKAEMLNKGSSFPKYKPLSVPLPRARFEDGSATYDAPPVVAAHSNNPSSSSSPGLQSQMPVNLGHSVPAPTTQTATSPAAQTAISTAVASSPTTNQPTASAPGTLWAAGTNQSSSPPPAQASATTATTPSSHNTTHQVTVAAQQGSITPNNLATPSSNQPGPGAP